MGSNGTEWKPVIRATELRKNSLYLTYYINFATLIVIGVIPLTFISFYNYKVYKAMRLRVKIAEHQRKISNKERSVHEHDAIKVLVGIVVVFMICHSLRLLLNFYEMILIKNVLDCIKDKQDGFPKWFLITKSFSALMLIINSSVNMIIYGCLNSGARRQILVYKYRMINILSSKSNSHNASETNEKVFVSS